MSIVLFVLFSVLCIGGACCVICHKDPVASAFSLLPVFLGFAGFYALLEAHLVATLQVLVYAGAIMVLFVFVIMLINPEKEQRRFRKNWMLWCGLILVSLIGFIQAILPFHYLSPTGSLMPSMIDELGGNTKVVSLVLVGDYFFPFELTSILLLAAIVISVVISKRKRRVR